MVLIARATDDHHQGLVVTVLEMIMMFLQTVLSKRTPDGEEPFKNLAKTKKMTLSLMAELSWHEYSVKTFSGLYSRIADLLNKKFFLFSNIANNNSPECLPYAIYALSCFSIGLEKNHPSRVRVVKFALISIPDLVFHISPIFDGKTHQEFREDDPGLLFLGSTRMFSTF